MEAMLQALKLLGVFVCSTLADDVFQCHVHVTDGNNATIPGVYFELVIRFKRKDMYCNYTKCLLRCVCHCVYRRGKLYRVHRPLLLRLLLRLVVVADWKLHNKVNTCSGNGRILFSSFQSTVSV